MKRRLTTFVLAAFYLLQGTWLLRAGMDLLLPTVREAVVAAAPDSCCNKACGCPEDVKAVYGCCCSKGTATPAPERQQGKTSFFEAARCKGVEAAMTQAFSQPVLCGFAALGEPVVESTAVALPEVLPHPVEPGTALDKVPI